jgi:hypothetical protein
MRKTQAGQRSDTVADKSSLALFELVPCCDSQASSDRSGPIRAEAFCASKVLSSCKNFAGKRPLSAIYFINRYSRPVACGAVQMGQRRQLRDLFKTQQSPAQRHRCHRKIPRAITHFSRESDTRCNPSVTASSIAGES